MKTTIKVMCWITTVIYTLMLLLAIGDPSYVDGDSTIVLGAFYLLGQSVLTLIYLHNE